MFQYRPIQPIDRLQDKLSNELRLVWNISIFIIHLYVSIFYYSAGLGLQPHTWCFGKTVWQALSLVWSIFHPADPGTARHSVSVCSARGVGGAASPGGQMEVPLEIQSHFISRSFCYRNKLWAGIHNTGKWYIWFISPK